MFLRLHARFLGVGLSNTRVSPDAFSQDSLSKVFIVWSGRKRSQTHEYIDEPLDQVKPDSCFQSRDEGRSSFCVALDQS